MIGFNPNGEVRVWMNGNYGKNQPARKRPILLTTISEPREKVEIKNNGGGSWEEERFMVRNIASVVEGKCEEGRFPDGFRSQLFSNCHTFEQARDLIRTEVQSKRVFMPNRIDFVTNRVPVNSQVISHHQTNVNNTVVRPAPVVLNQRPLGGSSGLRFNYQQPKEYFHPQMYARS